MTYETLHDSGETPDEEIQAFCQMVGRLVEVALVSPCWLQRVIGFESLSVYIILFFCCMYVCIVQ